MLLLIQFSLAIGLASLYLAGVVCALRWPTDRGFGRRVVFWGILPACAVLSILLADLLVRRDGSYDFAAFYSAGQLAGTPGLYARPVLAQSELSAGATSYMPFLRPPSYALALKPPLGCRLARRGFSGRC